MKHLQSPSFETTGEITAPERPRAALDLVVPFTTPSLTKAALRAANALGAGLNSTIRLLKVQIVPFPLDLRLSPVPVEFLEAQLTHLREEAQALPLTSEIRFAREFESGLMGALRFRSVVVLASRKRSWRTRTDRLTASLRRAGYTVILVAESIENA
jgi:hypothetical protein